MSGKISVVTLSLALVTLLCCSCTPKIDPALSSVLECYFSAEVTVESDGGEYEATITLGAVPRDAADSEDTQSEYRDGNVAYSYPETVSGISAVREKGVVTVNVCGIDIKPSENIARKYTALIDTADIRASSVERIEFEEFDGRPCAVLYVSEEEQSAVVYVDRESKAPVMIKTDTLTMTFKSFTKL